MLLSNSALIFFATLTSSAISHPLNLLHSHHHHHAHHHLHLRLPFRSQAAKSLQQPISGSNNPTTIPAAPDISNIFVNLTIKTSSSATSPPSSFLIPLRAAASTSSPPHAQLLTSPVFQHPRTAQISHIQHGVGPADSSRPFERAGDVACYAHTTQQEASASSSSSPSKKRRNAAVREEAAPQQQQQQQQRGKQLEPFRAADGEIDFADAGGRWASAPAGLISGFECVLSPP
ncbi:MAG: hypothetical protein Q9173_006485 [Seirophora scorigena]